MMMIKDKINASINGIEKDNRKDKMEERTTKGRRDKTEEYKGYGKYQTEDNVLEIVDNVLVDHIFEKVLRAH